MLAPGPETVAQAAVSSRTPTVAAIREFSVPILEYPALELTELGELLAELLRAGERRASPSSAST